MHERRAELHPLLVAQRERLDAVAGPVGDPEPLEPALGGRQRVEARAGRAARRSRRAGRARASSGTARAPPACSRSAPGSRGRPAPPRQRTEPRVRLQHAEDDPHRRRLAGAVGADEAEQLPRLDGERQPVERDDVAVPPRQVRHLQHPQRDSGCGGVALAPAGAERGRVDRRLLAAPAGPRAPRRPSRCRSRGSPARGCWRGGPGSSSTPRRSRPACSWSSRPTPGSRPRGSAGSPAARSARRDARRRGRRARSTCAWPCPASAPPPRGRAAGSRSAAGRPWRARWALIRHSVAARTCGSLAADGRSQEPAQPSTSGFGAAAWDEAPQPVSASKRRSEATTTRIRSGSTTAARALRTQRRMPVWPIE